MVTGMRELVAVREIRAGQMILIEGQDHPFIVATVGRFQGLVEIRAYDPDAVEILVYDRPTEYIEFLLNESDLAAILI